MKYIVGYPIKENKAFLQSMIEHKGSIAEVYFSFGDIPNGRSALTADEALTPFEVQQRQQEDLKQLAAAGIRLNLLFNGNCYGKDSQSRAFFHRIGNLIDYICREFGLASVTTSSPLIAKFIKSNFEGIDVRASVNMEIGSIEGLSYVSDVFDSFYLKREQNRNLAEIKRLRLWCDANGKQMYLLANSGCLNHCSAHTFHDNLVSHEAEIAAMDNGYQFRGVCWDFLAKEGSRDKWLQRTNFIRPEDVALYEGLVPAVKLATRVNAAPGRVLDAYLHGRYRGSVMELLEPNHSGVFYPRYVENANFSDGFASHVLRCDKHCENCHFCAEEMRRATVVLPADPSAKV
ncbi:MAG: hypothetical protein IJW51_01810 [Clostridia bacterium]|nr:hypothetical protein [Clostridia bacterium]